MDKLSRTKALLSVQIWKDEHLQSTNFCNLKIRCSARTSLLLFIYTWEFVRSYLVGSKNYMTFALFSFITLNTSFYFFLLKMKHSIQTSQINFSSWLKHRFLEDFCSAVMLHPLFTPTVYGEFRAWMVPLLKTNSCTEKIQYSCTV